MRIASWALLTLVLTLSVAACALLSGGYACEGDENCLSGQICVANLDRKSVV